LLIRRVAALIAPAGSQAFWSEPPRVEHCTAINLR
jgi:hypothetical protein